MQEAPANNIVLIKTERGLVVLFNLMKLLTKEGARQKGKCAWFPICCGKILMPEGIFEAGLSLHGLLNLL